MKLHKKVIMTPVTESVQDKWWNLLKILNKWRLKYAKVQYSHKVHQWAIILGFLPTIWLFQFSCSSSEEVGFFSVVHIMRVGTQILFSLWKCLAGVVITVRWSRSVGLVGLESLLGLVGMGCQVRLFMCIFLLFDLIQKYFQMEILSLMIKKNLWFKKKFMIQKNLMISKSLMF